MSDLVVVALGIMLLLVAGSAFALLRMPPERLESTVDGVGAVEARLAAGRVEIGEYDRSNVRVEILARRRPGRTRPVLTRAGDVLRLDGTSSDAVVRLKLPRGTKGRAEVRTGEITLWGSAGDLLLVTESGGITGRELTGGRINARSRSGDVNLHFDAPPDNLSAVSEEGMVILVLPDGDYEVEVETGNPQLASVELPNVPAARRRVFARSVAGKIWIKRASEQGPVRI
ncbi:DUF4097 family beta strand repeat-containing protein [Parafrankia sp. EUN1f]|uniref:DUF4097 family beta strand repeat-containing protein n=1 Tax=Parafrankia sp. EUN1f TaxID=102897 RepID=UPI0001C44335|nr:DUF4097 family beta strand repeat-containing protein [Parafrankia sp. EUN1f]EFC83799.1 hypothetical protein FrEUN1fDRAFT_3061 [Parafrankia sp. EUN1f]